MMSLPRSDGCTVRLNEGERCEVTEGEVRNVSLLFQRSKSCAGDFFVVQRAVAILFQLVNNYVIFSIGKPTLASYY